MTLGRRRRSRSHALFEDDERDSQGLTRDADDAAARQDWATAVVDRFRAIIRSLDERALVEEYPGLTAQEAGALACSALEDVDALHTDLHHAAGLFDAVRYGRVVSTAQQDEWMRRLAERVASAQPRRVQGPAGPAGTGGARPPARAGAGGDPHHQPPPGGDPYHRAAREASR